MENVQSNKAPLISVILPVYNAGGYIKDSIQSILDQSYHNFELIILNDGSTDNSAENIKSFNDSRIVYVEHANMGLAATLNKGISMAKSELIARQDQDDISLPERLMKQVQFMLNHPDVLLLGTWAEIFMDDGNVKGFHKHPSDPAILKLDLLFNNPFVHSSVMFKKNAVEKAGGYTVSKNYFEDYHLWSRLSEIGKVTNLPEILVRYRHHEKSLSKGGSYFTEDALFLQSQLNIENFLQKKSSVITDLSSIIHGRYRHFSGSSGEEMKNCLDEIGKRMMELYPDKPELISERIKQHKNVFGYTFNEYKLNKKKASGLNKFFNRIQNKLMGYHPYVINE